MGSPKLKTFPKRQTSPRSEDAGSPTSATDKLEIEQMIKKISQKLKDPELAKKAALIIEEMLKKNKK